MARTPETDDKYPRRAYPINVDRGQRLRIFRVHGENIAARHYATGGAELFDDKTENEKLPGRPHTVITNLPTHDEIGRIITTPNTGRSDSFNDVIDSSRGFGILSSVLMSFPVDHKVIEDYFWQTFSDHSVIDRVRPEVVDKLFLEHRKTFIDPLDEISATSPQTVLDSVRLRESHDVVALVLLTEDACELSRLLRDTEDSKWRAHIEPVSLSDVPTPMSGRTHRPLPLLVGVDSANLPQLAALCGCEPIFVESSALAQTEQQTSCSVQSSATATQSFRLRFPLVIFGLLCAVIASVLWLRSSNLGVRSIWPSSWQTGTVEDTLVAPSGSVLPPQPNSLQRATILVADFQGPDYEFGVTENLIERLRAATRPYPQIEIVPLRQSISPQQGSDHAMRLGKDYGATMVIWGWYRIQERAQLYAHVEMIEMPLLHPVTSETMTIGSDIEEFRSFEAQVRLSKEMVHLTLFILGIAQLQSDECQKAISAFDAALVRGETADQRLHESRVFFFRGFANTLLGNWKESIDDYTRAIEANNRVASAYLNRGLAQKKLWHLDEALQDYRRALTLVPGYVSAFINEGAMYMDLQRPDLALADYDHALALAPDLIDARQARARTYRIMGKYEEAIREYDLLLVNGLELAEIYLGRARAHASARHTSDAYDDIEAALALDPFAAEAYDVLGLLFVNVGDTEMALQSFNTALEIDPTYDVAYSNRSETYRRLGMLDRALLDISTALSLDPLHADRFAKRATILKKLGDSKGAIANYSLAMTLEASNCDFPHQRGHLYEGNKEFDAAVADYHRSISLCPEIH